MPYLHKAPTQAGVSTFLCSLLRNFDHCGCLVDTLWMLVQTGNGSWAVQGEQRGRKRAASQEVLFMQSFVP